MYKYIKNYMLKRRINATDPDYDIEIVTTMSSAPWEAEMTVEASQQVVGAFTQEEVDKRVKFCKSLYGAKNSSWDGLKRWAMNIWR